MSVEEKEEESIINKKKAKKERKWRKEERLNKLWQSERRVSIAQKRHEKKVKKREEIKPLQKYF